MGVEEEFRRAMIDAGLDFPGSIAGDGRKHRIRVSGDGRANTEYRLSLNGIAFGYFKDYKRGVYQTWHEQRPALSSPAEREAYRRKIAEAKKRREAETEREAALATDRARRLRQGPTRPSDGSHPYEAEKKIRPHGAARQRGNLLILDVHDVASGKLSTVQVVSPDGTKNFLRGSRTAGCAIFLSKGGNSFDKFFIAEGYATAATIHEATQKPVLAALSDRNLLAVGKALRKKYPKAELVFCADYDAQVGGKPGVQFAVEAAGAVNGLLAIPTLKNKPGAKCDFNDVHVTGGLDAVRALLDAAAPPPSPQPKIAALGQKASDIEAHEVEWLAPGRLALGKVHVYDGDPGLGKSLLTAHIVARLSRGRGAFLGDADREPCNSILISAEDDGADTVVPRLDAHDADLSRIRVVPGAIELDGQQHPITLPDDIPILENQIRADNAKSVFIDPVFAFISDKNTDTHNDNSVRRVLAELGALAQRTACAIILIRHLNKDSKQKSPVYRGGGSIGIIGATRAAFLTALDPTDSAPLAERRRIFAQSKNNLAPIAPSLAFRIVADGNVAHIEWCEEPSPLTAWDLLGARSARTPEALEEAKEFLRERLDEGPGFSDEIEKHAKALGIKERTLWRARKDLGIRAQRKGYAGGRWMIELPGGRDDAQPETKPQPPPSAAEILAECRMLGVALKIEGEDLIIPRGVSLPDRLMRELVAHEDEIFAMLKQKE